MNVPIAIIQKTSRKTEIPKFILLIFLFFYFFSFYRE